MVYRIFVEKKEGLRAEAQSLYADLKDFLGITTLESVRVVNRYDVENIDRELFNKCVKTVFSEPQTDNSFSELTVGSEEKVFAVEYLPGQFDQRADSAAQCIQIISCGEKPLVKTAKVYILKGKLSEKELEAVKSYVINPVEARLASLDKLATLKTDYAVPSEVKTLNGFIGLDEKGLLDIIAAYGLAMDLDDIKFCQNYFISCHRDPTLTEIKVIDTYWSDHCRHTTFLTTVDNVDIECEEIKTAYEEYIAIRNTLGRDKKPINLMDIATIGAKYLKKTGKLKLLDESEEINACTVKIKVEIDGEIQDWLLLFKNETHNHPTEIEPFGGAATCIGGAIRDPLSGRSYVYAAMRVTGAANPLKNLNETLVGKLPQRKIVTTAAAGYSSYGNQIGLATGIVDEIYHPGYEAKRMEIGAVIAAAPQANVKRLSPKDGDVVILLGGRTGRDGCGGATGSSKSHSTKSLQACGAEVQKGNAPEERKLQRLFRSKEASVLIKRCNDFGAGGVSVAIGELADGLKIDLNKVPKKYDGLDGTELAISESQERMAVVVAEKNAKRFIELAANENLEATIVATVTEQPRLVMNWNGKTIVDLSREFLNSNGAEKHTKIKVEKPKKFDKEVIGGFIENYKALSTDLNVCSKRGLSERFDSTIGAGTVMMPFGGKHQLTPSQTMVNKISCEKGDTNDCSFMSYGFNPYITEKSAYHGAYLAVTESVAKLVASGGGFKNVYLTFQEYFEKPRTEPTRWGKPFAALLGALKAQIDFSAGAIGGKDSMSGSFENIDVPPTLVSFAVTTNKTDRVVTPEFKKAGSKVVWLKPEYDANGLPKKESFIKLVKYVNGLIDRDLVLSAYTPTYGGAAEAIMKMCFGNKIGFKFNSEVSVKDIFSYAYGSFILEVKSGVRSGIVLGKTRQKAELVYGEDKLLLNDLLNLYEGKLEPVFSCNIKQDKKRIPEILYDAKKSFKSKFSFAAPKVLIPVFPGTNCEYDTAKALAKAGCSPEIFVIKNLTAKGIEDSCKEFSLKADNAQIIFIPGGFSGGDEPDGSGKFITAFFRNGFVRDSVNKLLKARDGLMCGICNGFQALIKLGLVPYGEITEPKNSDPTLTFNTIGRHQSKIVHTKVVSNNSPWLSRAELGKVYEVAISHGEGKFMANSKWLKQLKENGQIATQYVDLSGKPTTDVAFNPNDSDWAIEGITSPDGRVFGKMGHTERAGNGLYKNVPGEYDLGMFVSAAEYFK